MGSIVINGHTSFLSNSQIINSETFRSILSELIADAEKRKSSMMAFFELFMENADASEMDKKYNINGMIQIFIALTSNNIESIDASPYYAFPKLGGKREVLIKIVENLFNLWRSKQRFMIRKDTYTSNSTEKLYKEMVLVKTNVELKNLVLKLYREILINISDIRLKVLRQLPSGAQVGFIVDQPKFKEEVKIKNTDWLYNLPYVWSVVFEPPVIFYTKSNTRKGLYKVYDRPILDKLDIDNPEEWLVVPIHVGLKLIYVAVHKNYLSLASGLGNLFEIASFEIVESKKPDGIFVLGMKNEFFEDKKDFNGVVYKEEDGMYVAIVGDNPAIDYFGYMKKTVLTIHNLLVIDEGKLPIHGALAEIKLKNGKKTTIMLIGDSGAGKSETLDALNRLSDEVSEVNILIDDMGSVEIHENDIVAYGTETGAFVRLDDLQPGYAYSAMDRSIFMNPNEINARLIVPYSNYTEIIKPTKVDYLFYANNYEEINEEGKEVSFFSDADTALAVFSKGARMAKGTTQEKGLTTSYFANPFGAVQREAQHTEIARRYMNSMIDKGVKVGQIYTQLGRAGYEQNGPLLAAKTILKIIDNK